ncbi:Alkaline phosphodiesterase I [Clostridiaceae bacterium JG1575]|nr:Alkaline phosphodiesterase I [Clostridiaceae bacterium JG1575]
MNHQHIVILSLDALGSKDFRKLAKTPPLQTLMERGTYCDQVQSVCPSLTYPAHTSIVTGKWPRNHGIINNTKVQPDRDQSEWYWYRRDIHGQTLWDIARAQKKTVASLLWPVTGHARISYNLPEIFPVRAYQNQVLQVLSAGSAAYCLELNKKFKHLRRGIQQPELDHFVHQSALHTFRTRKPYLSLVHYVELDAMRHQHGYDSPEAKEALAHHEERLHDWIHCLKQEGVFEKTVMIVLGDHDQKPTQTVLRPNVLLHQLGLITLIENDIWEWKAYFKSCDGAGYFYVDPRYPEVIPVLRDNLTVLTAYEENGIQEFIDGAHAGARGADPQCAFMLFAKEGTYFDESPTGAFRESTQDQEDLYKSCHGFDPCLPDYTTAFLMSGPGIHAGRRVPGMALVDEGPTIAKLMGSSLWGVDGRIRYEFLKGPIEDEPTGDAVR